MGKSEKTVFVAVCMLICFLPFAGMALVPTNTTTENREMAKLPELTVNGSVNTGYLKELGVYFEDHFAFRNALVMADSVIQSRVFGVSNMDTVIAGRNGWLYYTSTLDDYQGKRTLSERGIWNAAHNLSMTQRFVEQRGASFLVTIAPNKNSLYGENMPYYYKKKINDTGDVDALKEAMETCFVSYVDLFEPFEKQKEVLYLKRDSHWNQKGAVLAYNEILDFLMLEHETYETVPSIRTQTEYGDLNKMLYPAEAYPEWNYAYQKENRYSYMTDTKSVEDVWIETKNKKGNGSLLMFRDSFGNTLLPLMADTFQTAYFSKSVPYDLEKYMESSQAEYVMVEKVERNIDDFAKEPPIMTGIQVETRSAAETVTTKTTLEIKSSEYNTDYWQIEGEIDEDYVAPDLTVYVKLTNGEYSDTYEAFTVSKEDSDWGYLLYLPKNEVLPGKTEVLILTKAGGQIRQVQKQICDMSYESLH